MKRLPSPLNWMAALLILFVVMVATPTVATFF